MARLVPVGFIDVDRFVSQSCSVNCRDGIGLLQVFGDRFAGMEFGCDSVAGNGHRRGPREPVQNGFAKVVVLPVVVKVSARRSKSTAFIFLLQRPGDEFSVGLVRRESVDLQDRCPALMSFGETHVEIEFLLDLERAHATQNRVLR